MTEETKTTEPAADAAASKSEVKADAPATPETTSQKQETDKPAPKAEQTVPLSRLKAVIAQKAEAERAREALARELKLSNDTLEEFRNLGKRTPIEPNVGTTPDVRTDPPPVRTDARSQRAPSPEELQRLVAQEAAIQEYNRKCNDAVAEGRKAHTDFDTVVLDTLTSVSPISDPRSGRPTLPQPLIEAALATGSASEVLYSLGQDIGEASRIMNLAPVAQAVAVAQFAERLRAQATESEAVRVSNAPPPIKAPSKGGKTTPSFSIYDTDNFDTKEWIRQREKQLADQRANR